MEVLITILHTITWLLYSVCSRLPFAAKFGALLPRWPDTFTPAAFFTAPSNVPSTVSLSNVPQSPASIIPLRRTFIRGKVTAVEVRPPTATWNHQTFYIEPETPSFLNTYNLHNMSESYPGQNGTLKCCPPLAAINLPKVGDRVAVYGTFGIDLANGWCIMEYVANYAVLSESTT